MATSYRERCKMLAKNLGVTLHTGNGEVNCEAPKGMAWNGDTHELIHSPWGADTRADVWRAAYEDMQESFLRPCAVEDCEWCEETQDA
jgi:hypothetical protein